MFRKPPEGVTKVTSDFAEARISKGKMHMYMNMEFYRNVNEHVNLQESVNEHVHEHGIVHYAARHAVQLVYEQRGGF